MSPGSFLRASAFVQMFLRQVDTFTIGAGTSGLSNGDPVQVRIQAEANTTLVLQGNPSGGSELVFNVEGVPGVTGRWVDWSVTSVYAPQELEFDESWQIVADTTVGASFTLRTNLEAQIGANSAQGPMEEPERSDATGLARVRVSPADGFEGIEITSTAGAPTTPLLLLPVLSPVGLIALVTGLGATALLGVRAGRRARGQRSAAA